MDDQLKKIINSHGEIRGSQYKEETQMFIAKNTNKIVLHMGAFILSASILTAGSVMTINAAGEHPLQI